MLKILFLNCCLKYNAQKNIVYFYVSVDQTIPHVRKYFLYWQYRL